ncbi:MAG: hypothetical protein ACRDN0_28040, partial [Trebonia sp.]
MGKKLDGALNDLLHGKLTRRAFAARAAALGIPAAPIGALLDSLAARAAEVTYPITGTMEEGSGGT